MKRLAHLRLHLQTQQKQSIAFLTSSNYLKKAANYQIFRKMSTADNGFTTNADDMKQAADMRSSVAEKSAGDNSEALVAFNSLPACVIDADAVQKYVLIRATFGETHEKYLVRGDQRANYHKDAARSTVARLRELNDVSYTVVGGGRIKHSSSDKTIFIYGYSYGFPWKGGIFKHEISAAACQPSFPDYEITTSNEGY